MGIIKLQPSGKEISIDSGQTILSALEKAGYALPNNCRAGACGECKAKVCGGSIDQGFVLDMALPQSERADGYGLMCMAKATSDIVEIEYGTEDALPRLFPPEENRPYLVIEKRQVTPSIVKIRLRSLGKNMRFWPGQYISLGNPKRQYSIANIPNEAGDIVLLITKVDGGITSVWVHDQLNEGQTVNIDGPYGTFIGDPSSDRPVLCLAAGSGLAPIRSLATAAMMRGGFKYPATILFSARTKEDVLEYGHFSYLKSKFRNFDFKVTYTKDKVEGELSGRIPEQLPELYPDLNKYSLYIAGSPDFVTACEEQAKKLGLEEEHIHVEKFQ